MKKICVYIIAVLLPMFPYAQTEDADQSLNSLYDSLYQYERRGDLNDGIRFAYQLLKESQNTDDRRLEGKISHTLSKLLYYNNLVDSSKALARSNIKYGEEIEDYDISINAANLLATFYFNESKYDSSEYYFKYCMEVSESYLPVRYPTSLVNMAFINGYRGQEEAEMTYYYKALRAVLAEPAFDSLGRVKAMAYGGIGDYYLRIKDYDKAKENFEAKLALGYEKNDKRMIFEAGFGLSTIYRLPENFDFEKSDKYLKIMLTDTTKEFGEYRGRALINLGKLYRDAKKYDQALKYLGDAYKVFDEGDGNDAFSRVEIEMGEVFLALGQIEKAEYWLKNGLNNAVAGKLALREKEALYTLYKIDSIKSDYKASLIKYQRLRAIQDSLFTEESAEKLSALQVEYETQKSERENLVLKSELALSEADLEKQKLIQWIITAAIVLAFFAIIILIRIYRRKQASNLQLASQNALITTQKEELSFKTDKLELVNSQLQSLAEFRTDLTQMIAHDMKNPLNSIIGISSIDPNDKHFKNITQSGYQLLNLVTNMLEVEKFQATDYVPKAVPTPLDQIILESRKRVEILLEAKSIRFESLIPKLICVNVDPEPIKRVFVNLISNAIKYSPTEGKIIVDKLKVVDNNIWIKVIDQGAGISPDRLPHVFEKFWQTNAKESGFAASTGLGLTFCKMTVEAHGGKIWAESEIGKGTSIFLTLPLETSQTCEKALAELNENVGVNHENEEVLIAPNELAELVEHAEFLRNLKIHQVSAINRILNSLEKKGIQSKWQTKLQATIYQADQDKYDELLKYLLEFNSNNS
ncbi:ATP-binding protein [Roseivirga sp.]|uniref:ATP-binding protein n=1 Tax=Roseivirga sp. TaxID=1964215 RepID=UPI003B8D10B1